MTLVTDLKSIDGNFATTSILIFLSTLCAGVLTIYLFLPELFLTLDTVKFILFSLSLSLPLFILNAFFSVPVLTPDMKKGEKLEFQMIGVLSGFFSSLIAYSALLSAYIFSLKFSGFLAILSGGELIYIVICLSISYKSVSRKNAN